jgi:hypothetical protein
MLRTRNEEIGNELRTTMERATSCAPPWNEQRAAHHHGTSNELRTTMGLEAAGKCDAKLRVWRPPLGCGSETPFGPLTEVSESSLL